MAHTLIAARTVFSSPVHWLAFGFGSGLAPRAPGTVGTGVAALLYLWGLSHLSLGGYCLVLVLAGLVGVWICGESARRLGIHDHSGIVWDEFVGFWITMLVAPSGIVWVFLGFVLFRFFDIVKPWPIHWIDQRVQGGAGIMLDDVVAGIMAACCLQGLVWFWYFT